MTNTTELQQARDRVAELKGELQTLRAAPVPREELLERLDRAIEQQAAAYKPDLAAVFAGGRAGAAFRPVGAWADDPALDLAVTLAALMPERLREVGVAEIDRFLADREPGLPAAERQDKVAAVAESLFEAEVAEEGAVAALEQDGEILDRREDLDPAAFFAAYAPPAAAAKIFAIGDAAEDAHAAYLRHAERHRDTKERRGREIAALRGDKTRRPYVETTVGDVEHTGSAAASQTVLTPRDPARAQVAEIEARYAPELARLEAAMQRAGARGRVLRAVHDRLVAHGRRIGVFLPESRQRGDDPEPAAPAQPVAVENDPPAPRGKPGASRAPGLGKNETVHPGGIERRGYTA